MGIGRIDASILILNHSQHKLTLIQQNAAAILRLEYGKCWQRGPQVYSEAGWGKRFLLAITPC